ncbi:MAG: class I SAM-dependent methyltransferase [Nitrospiraceae bacterium]|nr:class I SAM-dependent methyltransferase [Nitrospiraceae bacterium]
MNERPIAAGKSSFDLIDPNRLFSELQLRSDTVLLDLACGSGSYSLFASKFIGTDGAIYAFDLWKEGIDHLSRGLAVRQLRQIHAGVADVSRKIPLGDHSVDVCLMATVLHDLIQDKTEEGTLREVKRVLRPDGILAVVEFKKVEGPPGPPLEIRVSPEELEDLLFPYGFGIAKKVEVGPYNYLSVFQKRHGT